MNIQDKTEVRELIKDACNRLNHGNTIYDSPQAVELLIGTWAVESNGGKYLRQIRGGPALSAWQIESATFQDTITRCWPVQRYVLNVSAGVQAISINDFEKIETNHILAIQIARLKYFLGPGEIPQSMTGQAAYWKVFFNTRFGKGTTEKYIEKYQKYAM